MIRPEFTPPLHAVARLVSAWQCSLTLSLSMVSSVATCLASGVASPTMRAVSTTSRTCQKQLFSTPSSVTLQRPAGRQPFDAAKKAGAQISILRGEVQGDFTRVDLPGKPLAGKNGLVLRSEDNPLAGIGHRHRLDAQAVARQPQFGVSEVEIGKGKHSIEKWNCLVRAPMMQRLNDDLSVGGRTENKPLRLQ